jgi:hypothetical protein
MNIYDTLGRGGGFGSGVRVGKRGYNWVRRPRASGTYFQLATELAKTFARTAHSNSGFPRAPHLRLLLLEESPFRRLALRRVLIGSICNAHHSGGTAGMPMHIRKAFLHDAKTELLGLCISGSNVGQLLFAAGEDQRLSCLLRSR